jgi:hypothetical protein
MGFKALDDCTLGRGIVLGSRNLLLTLAEHSNCSSALGRKMTPLLLVSIIASVGAAIGRIRAIREERRRRKPS